MNLLQIRNLLFLSLFLLLQACAIRNYSLTGPLNVPSGAIPLPATVFPDTLHTALFKADIKLYGKNLSGLLFLKQTEDKMTHLVMTTETGISVFNVELQRDTMIVHYCMDRLNKPGVLKTIETDVRLVLMEKSTLQNPELLHDRDSSHTVYKYQRGKRITYYFIENKTGYLDRIELASSWYKKVTVTLDAYVDRMAYSLSFRHYRARLRIKLKLLKFS